MKKPCSVNFVSGLKKIWRNARVLKITFFTHKTVAIYI